MIRRKIQCPCALVGMSATEANYSCALYDKGCKRPQTKNRSISLRMIGGMRVDPQLIFQFTVCYTVYKVRYDCCVCHLDTTARSHLCFCDVKGLSLFSANSDKEHRSRCKFYAIAPPYTEKLSSSAGIDNHGAIRGNTPPFFTNFLRSNFKATIATWDLFIAISPTHGWSTPAP